MAAASVIALVPTPASTPAVLLTFRKAPTVSLYLRDGNSYYTPVTAANHKLRPLYGWVKLKDGSKVAKKFDDAIYCLRFKVDGVGKRTWEKAGNDPDQALVAQKLKRAALLAQVNHLLGPVKSVPVTSLTAAAKDYLEEILDKVTAKQLTRNTYLAYRRVINSFLPFVVKAPTFDKIARTQVLKWMHHEQARLAPYTVFIRVKVLKIFLDQYKAEWPLLDKDMPTYTESPAKPYSDEHLNAMLAVGDVDEIDLLMFFYGCGGRNGEVKHGCYTDLNFERLIFNVTEKRAGKRSKKKDELDWKTKDEEEGEIPLDLVLMERMRARRARYPDAKFIFANKNGKPNKNLLTILKKLAFRAGINCGECLNKHGLCCKGHPTCQRVILHRLRKNFATMQHNAGVPTKKLQEWLRHSDLETTEGYIASSANDTPEVRAKVNRAFGHLVVPTA
jgi:integrase/recombinase XerD